MQNKIEQTNKVTIYFAVENDSQLLQIKQTTCSIFEGYTLTKTFGGWVNTQNNELLEETSYKLEIFTNKESINVDNLCEHICKIAKQCEVYSTTEKITLTKTINY